MNDWKTSDIVSSIFKKIGYKILSRQAKEEKDLEVLIGFLKYKKNNFSREIRDLIEYFL